MKIREIVKEDATAGGTSAGAVAAVVAPLGSSKKKKKKTEMIRRGKFQNSISENATAGGVSAGSVASSVRMPKKLPKKRIKEVVHGALPRPDVMAMKVLDAFDDQQVPPEVAGSPEPYRAMLWHMGFKDQDGTPWWDAVMDELG